MFDPPPLHQRSENRHLYAIQRNLNVRTASDQWATRLLSIGGESSRSLA